MRRKLSRWLHLVLVVALGVLWGGVTIDSSGAVFSFAAAPHSESKASCCDSDHAPDTDGDECPPGCRVCPRCAGVTAVLAIETPQLTGPTIVVLLSERRPGAARDGVHPPVYTPPRSHFC
ncbi:MAG: hypothetical protein IV100_20700 [Myxococcales bacterium]|nr:hypothetical protein [Myxococcales bacterium]